MHELTFGRLLGSEMWTFGGELIFRQRITFREGLYFQVGDGVI